MTDPLHGRYALADGRTVSLARLLITPTYEGVLEGRPAYISQMLRQRLAVNVPRALGCPAPLVILDDGQAELPPYRWAATFTSPRGVQRADNPDYSSRMSLCGFTSIIPADIHAMIAEALAAVDWDADAEDYDIMP